MKSSPDLYWFVIATKNHPNLSILKDHSIKHNISLRILGMGDNRFQNWGKNFGVKLELFHRQLLLEVESGLLSIDDVVLLTDAFDVIMIDDKPTFMNKFLKLNSDIVIASEVNCHPDPTLCNIQIDQNPEYRGMYRFVNSGLIAGRTKSLIDLFNSNHYSVDLDDQLYWTKNYISRRKCGDFLIHHIYLDVYCQLFMCVAFASDDLWISAKDRKVWCISNESNPSFLHFNGCHDLLDLFIKEFRFVH